MIFKGIQKVSFIDYPEKISCVLFTGGCNFRCRYCHNPELVIGYEDLPDITEDFVFDYLERRKNLLDAVVVCGGEPTLHKDLPDFLKKVKEKGFLTKLDTNGTNPEMIEKCLPYLTYIAMDVKASPDRYSEAVGVKVDLSKIEESINIVKNSGKNYEFRLTLFPYFFKIEDAYKLEKWLKDAELVVIQKPQTVKTLDPSIKEARLFKDEELEEIKKRISRFVKKCIVR